MDISEKKNALKAFINENKNIILEHRYDDLYALWAFDAKYLTQLLIDANVDLFKYLTNIPAASIPKDYKMSDIEGNIKFIDEYAFAGNTQITDLRVHEGVDQINRYAFTSVVRLERIILPESLTYIGRFAFNDCINLKSVTIQSHECEIDAYAFRNCTNLRTISCTADIYTKYFKNLDDAKYIGIENLDNIEFYLM